METDPEMIEKVGEALSHIIPERLPEVCNTPDPWLGERTIQQCLDEGDYLALYTYFQRLFSYTESGD